jgi:antibiotic biosynthesis monooxygenase (ABM) superfamily enzyme
LAFPLAPAEPFTKGKKAVAVNQRPRLKKRGAMNYLEINSSGTTLVKTGPGYFQGITVNAAGSSWTLQIFDNVSATAPAIAGGAGAFTIPPAGNFVEMDVHFKSGPDHRDRRSDAGQPHSNLLLGPSLIEDYD